jgi:hypothetical protein
VSPSLGVHQVVLLSNMPPDMQGVIHIGANVGNITVAARYGPHLSEYMMQCHDGVHEDSDMFRASTVGLPMVFTDLDAFWDSAGHGRSRRPDVAISLGPLMPAAAGWQLADCCRQAVLCRSQSPGASPTARGRCQKNHAELSKSPLTESDQCSKTRNNIWVSADIWAPTARCWRAMT